MSTTKSITPVITPNASSVCLKKEWEGDQCCKPDFIYGGPFINVKKDEPFLDTATPFNLQLQGTFKKYVHLLP
ncbi:Bromo-adjacent domain-containing protein [Operophtera brumata]|uniref:Bromo-adjacent domain-containing protein n=1 Tax=Operophtera brumata TaxID=104452 RepID=A0A0L7KX20_OPEBR|nr:Bromo-adjacent domain-containing protein [Operophtera brumata]